MKKPGALVRYDEARRALAAAHRVDEVKSIRDKAVAMQAYAKQAKDTTLITQATDIRMRAERRAGELLIEMSERNERRAHSQRSRGETSETLPPKLSDLGINKTQSSRWQRLALIEPDKFEANVARASMHAYDRMTRRFVKEAEIERAQRHHQKVVEYGCTVDDLVALTASGKQFAVIYADPPWPFETWGKLGKTWSAPDNHYGTSPIDEICALPVAPLAADDAVLLLWCTWPHMAIGTHVEVIRAWGFEPKTAAFVWVKRVSETNDKLATGMGYFTRSNSEVCLLATKGSPKRVAEDVHQIVFAPVGKHSAKPEEVRRRIERLLAGPYLELYGRKRVDGWTVWGDEIERAEFAMRAAE